MISREIAIQTLKDFWGTEDLTFLAKFNFASNKGGKLAENEFGFFENLNFNKKQLLFPPFENKTNIPASCFALKGDLETDVYYMVTVELSDDLRRKKNPFLLNMAFVRKATEEEIQTHKSNSVPITIQKKKPEKLYVAYLNFVAEDNSHAYIKIIEDLTATGVKNARGSRGDIIKNIPVGLVKQQLIIVKKTKNNFYQFDTDYFQGYAVYNGYFLNTHLFESVFHIHPIKLNLNENDERDKLVPFAANFKIYDCINNIELKEFEEDSKIILPDLSVEIELKTNTLLSKKYLDDNDLRALKIFEKIEGEFIHLKEIYFEQDFEDLLDEFDIEDVDLIFDKWMSICPELILYKKLTSIIENIDVFYDHFLQLWLENKLPIDFFEEKLIDFFIPFSLINKEKIDDLINTLSEYQIELIKIQLTNLLDKGFSVDSKEIYDVIIILMNKISPLSEQKNNIEKLNKLLNEDIKFELWTSGIINEIPVEKAILHFKELECDQKEEVMFILDDQTIKPLLKYITTIKNKDLRNRIYHIKIDQIFNELNPISFDMECKDDTIYEIAWNEEESWFNFLNNKVREGIEKFKSIQNTNHILVGHNIIEFDLPILKRLENLNYNENKIWDTFKVEMILSPEFKTYALNTTHKALQDAQHTYELFKNQLFRILKSDTELLNSLISVLGEKIFSNLIKIKNELYLEENLDELNQSKLTFFRPQPKVNSVIQRLDAHINDSNALRKIVLGTTSMFQDLLSYGKVIFLDEQFTSIDFQRLDKSKIENKTHLDEFLKSHLLNYIKVCLGLNKIPYWGNVSPAIRLNIEQKIDVWSFFESKIKLEGYSKFPIFLSVDQIEDYFNEYGDSIDTDLFILQPDLISISQKNLIKKLDVEQLKVLFPDNYFWLKFSGGQSVLELENNLIKNLDFDGIESFDNYWIEKYYVGKYRIYGSKNWEKTLEKLDFKNRISIDLDPENFLTEQVKSIKFKVNPNNNYNITRFNPESIYRARYWVIQKKIIDQLLHKGSTVLLVLRNEEVSILNEYFEKSGYYIPNAEISLGRRLELLHRYKSEKKIIIAHINEGDAILKLNHTDPINLILDSFNLLELYFCSKGTSFFNSMLNEGAAKSNELIDDKDSEDESIENLDSDSTIQKEFFIKDTFFLLKLLLPKLTHFRNLLKLNNHENKLWLLDPRIDDYAELCKHWNIGTIHVNGWESKDKFEEDVKVAESYINSPKLNTIPFSTEEEMEVIRKVFIPDYDWKQEQIPYIKNILESNDDLLVILPTGVGKSILFHGPAILKSSFTNRMTIVVTPLKALMEDQVNKLWDLGFFGGVEYLNSERSAEKEFIYRSLAGGELSLLFVTPERFRSRGFLNALESRIQSDGGLEYFVFDEAHCLSQWGQDFRPDYFNCAKHIYNTKKASDYNTPLLLFSATVSKKIYNDFNFIFS